MTRFTMKTPCDSCPFVRKNNFYLEPARVQEIEDHCDGPFPCHQTVDYGSWDDYDDPDGQKRNRDKEVHCLGQLILQFTEWNGFGTVGMLAASFGLFDPKAMPTAEEADVFESWEEMREHMRTYLSRAGDVS